MAVTTTAHAARQGRWIDNWDPEDPEFWETTGRIIARQNLIFSILAEHFGFSVWVMWSIVTLHLNDKSVGFNFTESQLFWLIAIPSLVGAALRIPYTFAVPKFGGRNWTIVSALLLLIPALGLAWAVSRPETSFGVMLLIAATAGFGGGNFASSMTNISFFYPEKEKGWALGLNAAGGNIGVAVVQAPITVAAVIAVGAAGATQLAFAGLMWVPLALIAALCAWLFMDNLAMAKADVKSSAAAAKRPHTWVMSFLYIGTFGSFMGFAGAFPLLIKGQFPDVDVVGYAFLGALVGSLVRPIGGRLADRIGGAKVTAVSFFAMGLGVFLALQSLQAKNFGLFLLSFMVLFAATGIGNGSTYRMIPAIFRFTETDPKVARREGAAAIGIISAVGAFGGFLVPRTFVWSTANFGSIQPAMKVYIGVYVVMFAVTWFYYLRPSASLAKSGV